MRINLDYLMATIYHCNATHGIINSHLPVCHLNGGSTHAKCFAIARESVSAKVYIPSSIIVQPGDHRWDQTNSYACNYRTLFLGLRSGSTLSCVLRRERAVRMEKHNHSDRTHTYYMFKAGRDMSIFMRFLSYPVIMIYMYIYIYTYIYIYRFYILDVSMNFGFWF